MFGRGCYEGHFPLRSLSNFAIFVPPQDAFFWVGTSGPSPGPRGTILPHPFAGEFPSSSDPTAPVLQRMDGTQEDIELPLPPELELEDIRCAQV